MIKKIFLSILLLATSLSAFSQSYFKGLVIENGTSKKVDNAIVTIEDTVFATRTNENGEFVFNGNIPIGEHVVSITKEGYDTKFLLIQAIEGKNIIMEEIRIEVNKKEKKRRSKEQKGEKKNIKKLEKEHYKKLKQAEKEKKEKEKLLIKEKKKLLKNKGKDGEDAVPVVYKDVIAPQITIDSGLQQKFGALLDVAPETITNSDLYRFIDTWLGTQYVLGGETTEGIDCSSFTQRFYTSIYDVYIERTAEKQFKSKLTDKFLGKEYLEEGDLIFFKGSGKDSNTITHVGVYLANSRFVHATSYKKDTGLVGVKISNLNDSFWTKRFVAGGRRLVK